MTLHQTVEAFKKFGIASSIGLAGIIALVIVFRIGLFVKDMLFPVVADPANYTYGKLPVLIFPENATAEQLTYSLDTESGAFEVFPDRLNVYKVANPEAGFLNLEQAREKARAIEMISNTGEVVPEIPLGNANYEWDEPGGLQRRLIFNIVSFDFTLNSNYLTSLTVLNAIGLPDEKGAVKTTTEFLESMTLLPDDLDLTKSEAGDKKVSYYTSPQLIEIRNGELIPATSLSTTDVIRVNLYQKDVEYKLDTGLPSNVLADSKMDMKLPILYPKPPYSTMSLWVGMGPYGPSIVNAQYSHKSYTVVPNEEPTYTIKTPDEAFEELKAGSGYIASFASVPGDAQVNIKNAYLAYYLGENPQSYLMPIYVFEGDKNFFGYVSAVVNDWVE